MESIHDWSPNEDNGGASGIGRKSKFIDSDGRTVAEGKLSVVFPSLGGIRSVSEEEVCDLLDFAASSCVGPGYDQNRSSRMTIADLPVPSSIGTTSPARPLMVVDRLNNFFRRVRRASRNSSFSFHSFSVVSLWPFCSSKAIFCFNCSTWAVFRSRIACCDSLFRARLAGQSTAALKGQSSKAKAQFCHTYFCCSLSSLSLILPMSAVEINDLAVVLRRIITCYMLKESGCNSVTSDLYTESLSQEGMTWT